MAKPLQTSKVGRTPGVRAVPGEIVVKLTQAARQEPRSLERILKGFSTQARIKSAVDRFGIALLQVAPADTNELLDCLRQSDSVDYAEPNLLESGS